MRRRPLTAVREQRQRVWARMPQRGMTWAGLLILLLGSAGCRAMLAGPEVTARPTPVVTPYTEPLQCLGRLFDAYYGRNQFRLVIAVEAALDKTAGAFKARDEIPTEITLLVVSALTKIHPHLVVSNAFLTPAERHSEGIIRPNLTVTVGISTYDRATSSQAVKGNLEFILPWNWFQGPEAEVELERASSDLSIDLVVFDYPSQVAKSFAPATIEMKLVRKSRRFDGGLGVYIVSLGGSVIQKEVTGAGSALRMMVELGVVQLLGRRFRLPYTRCLDAPMHDPLLEQSILNRFADLSPLEQGKAIRELLRGYGERVPLERLWDAGIDARLKRLRQRHGLKWRPGNRAQAYLAVYTNLPLPPRA